MAEERRIFSEPWDVNRRAAELGLTTEILRKAVEEYLSACASYSDRNYPRNFPACAGWAEAVCSLGDQLAPNPFQWTRIDPCGQPLVINRTGTIALTVAGGDKYTGTVDLSEPRTKNNKGPMTVDFVNTNAFLFPEMEEDKQAKTEQIRTRSRNTWILLIHRDMDAREVRSELSLPTQMDQEGHICGWSDRIILNPLDFDGIQNTASDNGGESDGGNITVEIKRRG